MRRGLAKALRATLREYQATGVNWLAFLSKLGLGACLADDMGLGKDDSGDFVASHSEKGKGRKPITAGSPRVTRWQLEVGNRKICTLTFGPVCPHFAIDERRAGRHGG